MRLRAIAVAVGALGLAAAAPPPIDPATVTIGAQPLGLTVTVLSGRGGNVGVIAGRRGLVLIDGEFAALTEKLLAAVAAIDPRNPRMIVNTHWHRDHVGANERLAQSGAFIIAHVNTARRMAEPQLTRAFEHIVPPLPADALPSVTYTDTLRLDLGDEQLELIHVPHAHTDGDTLVRLVRADVLFTGDVVVRGLPFIERASEGSIDGLVAALERAIALATPRTRVVPGHGPVIGRAELIAYHNMLRGVRAGVADGIARGLTISAIVAAKPAARWDTDPRALPFARGDVFVRAVYDSLLAVRRAQNSR